MTDKAKELLKEFYKEILKDPFVAKQPKYDIKVEISVRNQGRRANKPMVSMNIELPQKVLTHSYHIL